MTTTSTRNAAAAASSTFRLVDGLEERARPPHQANSGKTNNARIYYTIEVELKVCPEKKDICVNTQKDLVPSGGNGIGALAPKYEKILEFK